VIGDCDQVAECVARGNHEQQPPSEMSEEPKGWRRGLSTGKRKASLEGERRPPKSARTFKRQSADGLNSSQLQDDFLSYLFLDQVCTVGHVEKLLLILTDVVVSASENRESGYRGLL